MAGANNIAILEHPDNQKLIREKLDSLCAHTQQSRRAFEEIYILLDGFDRSQFKTGRNDSIEPLRPHWDELRHRHDVLLDFSKADAIAIKAICEDYKANILSLLTDDDRSPKMKDVRQEILSFRNRTEIAYKTTKALRDEFDKLRVDVRTCTEKIRSAFNDATADPTGKGSQMEEAIQMLINFIHEGERYINNALEARDRASNIILSALGLGNASAGAIDHMQEQIDGFKNDVERGRSELEELAQNQHVLQKLRENFKYNQSNFITIIDQLASLETLWQATSADFAGLTIHMQTGCSEDTTLRTFLNTVGERLSGHIYGILAEVLGKYISQMDMLDSTPVKARL
ncbi:hypothetical protein C8R43DRAFT_1228864 [Mycena crocata]|nr:hypothetical protein C8R43DRAFT_1228864 [Mycena crocata]